MTQNKVVTIVGLQVYRFTVACLNQTLRMEEDQTNENMWACITYVPHQIEYEMRGVCSMRGGMTNVYSISEGEPESNRPLRTHRRR